MTYDEKYNRTSIIIFDDNNNEIIRLILDEKGAIESLHTDYEGFYLSVGLLNGEFRSLIVSDKNTMFQELTQLNREEGVLVYRMESYKTFTNEYRRFADGKINIMNWEFSEIRLEGVSKYDNCYREKYFPGNFNTY